MKTDRMLSFVAGALTGAVLTFGASHVPAIPIVGDPLGYATIVDKSRPIVPVPLQNIERLEKNTNTDWHISLFQDQHPGKGGQRLATNPRGLKRLKAEVAVPDLKDYDVEGVFTNVLDEQSVAANGALYVVWFKFAPRTSLWLRQDVPIFIDKAVDERRKTYLAGQYAIYYAPPTTGTDWTSKVDRWVAEVVQCPTHAAPCDVIAKR